MRLCNGYHSQYGSDFRCIVPCSLVGLGDNFSVEESHVIPALIRKFHEAKIAEHPSVTIWGTGAPVREFMDVDDLADACIFVMSRSKEVFHGKASELGGVVNIGSGHEITILRLAKLIAGIVGFRGKILTDPTKPDGTPRKIVNSAGITSMGWSPARDLESGVKLSYQEFLDKHCRKNPLTQ